MNFRARDGQYNRTSKQSIVKGFKGPRCARRDAVMHSDLTSEDECKWFWRHMIYSPETNTTLILTSSIIHPITLLKAFLKMFTLCTLGPLHHAWPVLPSSSCSMSPPSLLGVDCLSPSLLGGPGPPSPPSPELTPFPSGPRQRPTLMLGTHANSAIQSAQMKLSGNIMSWQDF